MVHFWIRTAQQHFSLDTTSIQTENLKNFLLSRATGCIHEPQGVLAHRFVVPTYDVQAGADDQETIPQRSTIGHYLQMYDWDACWFSQGAYRLGQDHLARPVALNFWDQMQPDGHIPRTLSPFRIWDQGDLCKPLLCQTLLMEETRSGQCDYLDLPKIEKYFSYLEQNRRDSCGLYHWQNVLESGVDNNLALLAPLEASRDANVHVGDFPDGRLLAVDLNSYLVCEFQAFSQLCQNRKQEKLAEKYASLSKDLAQTIEQLLWNQETGIYCNVYPDTHQQVVLRSWTGLLPVLLGFAPGERAEQVIKKNILNQEHFLRPSGLVSTAASEPLYNQSMRGLYGRIVVSNWQGPLWVLPNVLAARGLRRYNYAQGAQEIARRVITTLARDLENTKTLHENYNAETGEGMWAPKFISWNFLALELIDLL